MAPPAMGMAVPSELPLIPLPVGWVRENSLPLLLDVNSHGGPGGITPVNCNDSIHGTRAVIVALSQGRAISMAKYPKQVKDTEFQE